MGDDGDADRSGFDALTPRERECLRLVARHHRSKEIARLLNISKSTVDKHIDRARERLGAADRRAAALALVAHEHRLGIEYPPDPDPIPSRVEIPPPEALFDNGAGARSEYDTARRGAGSGATPGRFGPGIPGQLGGAGDGAQPAGQPGSGRPDSDGGLGPARAPGNGPAGEAAGPDPQRHGLADQRRSLLTWGGVHALTPLRLMLLVALVAIVGSLLLGGVLMGAHEVALLVQRLVDGIVPPRG